MVKQRLIVKILSYDASNFTLKIVAYFDETLSQLCASFTRDDTLKCNFDPNGLPYMRLDSINIQNKHSSSSNFT